MPLAEKLCFHHPMVGEHKSSMFFSYLAEILSRGNLNTLSKLNREAAEHHVAELQALVAEFGSRFPGKGRSGPPS